ncbi:uncharacterized protein [Miscanthus floridulus]|uniref:uncharacterized protein n=1 Tax=Miscanthus floridulus TaxID=154761 RepID=UPI003459B1BD
MDSHNSSMYQTSFLLPNQPPGAAGRPLAAAMASRPLPPSPTYFQAFPSLPYPSSWAQRAGAAGPAAAAAGGLLAAGADGPAAAAAAAGAGAGGPAAAPGAGAGVGGPAAAAGAGAASLAAAAAAAADQTGCGLAVAHHYRTINHYHTTSKILKKINTPASAFPSPLSAPSRRFSSLLRTVPTPPSAAAAPAPGEVTAAKHRVRLCSPRAGTSSWAAGPRRRGDADLGFRPFLAGGCGSEAPRSDLPQTALPTRRQQIRHGSPGAVALTVAAPARVLPWRGGLAMPQLQLSRRGGPCTGAPQARLPRRASPVMPHLIFIFYSHRPARCGSWVIGTQIRNFLISGILLPPVSKAFANWHVLTSLLRKHSNTNKRFGTYICVVMCVTYC